MAREFFVTIPGGFDGAAHEAMRAYLHERPHLDVDDITLLFSSREDRDAYVARHGGAFRGSHVELHPFVALGPEITLSTVGGDVDRELRDFAAWCQSRWPCRLEGRFGRADLDLDELTWFEREPAVDAWAAYPFPLGCLLDGGTYRVITEVHAAPDGGVYVAERCDGAPGRFWVTIAPHRPVDTEMLAARLSWPLDGIAPLRRIGAVTGKQQGYDGLVEELPDGDSSTERDPNEAAVAIALSLSELLATAHARGWAIGGVQPETVFVAEAEGELRFRGLVPRGPSFARHAGAPPAATLFGDRVFCSPEELAGAAATPASDVFALCATIAEWIVGSPFGRGSADDQIARITSGRSARWTGPASLAPVIERGLAVDPAARPSMQELVAALRAEQQRR